MWITDVILHACVIPQENVGLEAKEIVVIYTWKFDSGIRFFQVDDRLSTMHNTFGCDMHAPK